MVLPITLRRILLLMISAVALIITITYWKRNLAKDILLNDAVSLIMPENNPHSSNCYNTETFVVPPEKIWTYTCVNDRCVRRHYVADHKGNKRITLQSCLMLCGAPNIWPQPTVRTLLDKKSSQFASKFTKYYIDCKYQEVKDLLNKTMDVFNRQLNLMESQSLAECSKSLLNANECVKKNAMNVKHRSDNGLNVNVHIMKYKETFLTFGTDESYNLTMKHENKEITVNIYANSFFGAKHGLTTLQQLIWFDDESLLLKTYTYAEIVDSPKFNYRGLMLDTSRHYFSVESIKRTLEAMSFTKLNRFHWHITDSQSFPFLSKYYPELAAHGAYSNSEVYTTDDVKDVVEFAKIRGIQVVPEIDAPAHAGNGWDWGVAKGLGQLSLCINQQPWEYYCGEPPCGQLNPKNNNTLHILEKLYQELIQLAGPLDYFHLGGDEVNLECWAQHFNETDLKQLWCDFMLNAFERLKKANNGKSPTLTGVWSSGLTSMSCLQNKNFAVQVWGASTWQENRQLLENGFNLILSHVDAWYLDCGFGSWRTSAEGACSPYRSWQNIYLHRPWERMGLTVSQMKQILGGEVCLWTEQVDETQLDARLWPRSAALAERLWTDPSTSSSFEKVPSDVFSRMANFRNRLLQLGVMAEPIFPKYCSQNPNECL